MSNYTNAFENTDIRLIGQRGNGVGTDPWAHRQAAHKDIKMKETSLRPMTSFTTSYPDPVYNIALQNPLAQPGGGAAPMVKHRTDMADLYGVQYRIDSVPNVPVVSNRCVYSGAFSSNRASPQAIQQAYYNAGSRAEGDLFVVNNATHGPDHTEINRRNGRHGERKYEKRNYEHNIAQNNSIVYTGTCLNAQRNPTGSGGYQGTYNSGVTYNNNLPPKTLVDSTDTTVFVAY